MAHSGDRADGFEGLSGAVPGRIPTDVFEPLWAMGGTRPEPGANAVRGPSAPGRDPEPDLYRCGYEDGLKEADRLCAEALAKARSAFEDELDAARREGERLCADALGRGIDAELTAIENRLQSAACDLLASLMRRRMTAEATDELVAAVARVVEFKGHALLRLMGPVNLLPPISAELQRHGWQVDAVAADIGTLVVEVDDTSIVSALPAWIAQLDALIA